jgi:hypothetical protein
MGFLFIILGENKIKKIVFALVALFLANQTAYATDASCDSRAVEKKLAGAAKNSFIKKCEKDAKVNAKQNGLRCKIC